MKPYPFLLLNHLSEKRASIHLNAALLAAFSDVPAEAYHSDARLMKRPA